MSESRDLPATVESHRILWYTVPNPVDTVNVVLPTVLRDRLAEHRLHARQPLYEIIEDALESWEAAGGWRPFTPLRLDR